MGLTLAVVWATAMGAYGIWYSIFAKEFNRYTGFRKSRYEPKPYQRIVTLAGSLVILIFGVAELVRLWK
jgi:hypothetical protein